MAPSGVRRGARGLGLSPAPCTAAPVVFTAIRAAMLRRRIHLLALRRVSPRIRRTASPHVAQFGTRPPRPLPHLPLWRVFFVALALADSWSARLTLSAANPPEMPPPTKAAQRICRGEAEGVFRRNATRRNRRLSVVRAVHEPTRSESEGERKRRKRPDFDASSFCREA